MGVCAAGGWVIFEAGVQPASSVIINSSNVSVDKIDFIELILEVQFAQFGHLVGFDIDEERVILVVNDENTFFSRRADDQNILSWSDIGHLEEVASL